MLWKERSWLPEPVVDLGGFCVVFWQWLPMLTLQCVKWFQEWLRVHVQGAGVAQLGPLWLCAVPGRWAQSSSCVLVTCWNGREEVLNVGWGKILWMILCKGLGLVTRCYYEPSQCPLEVLSIMKDGSSVVLLVLEEPNISVRVDMQRITDKLMR